MSAFNEKLTLDQKILEWAGNAEALARLKKIEMEQRKELVGELFPEPKYGTQHHDLGGGYKVTFVHKQDTKLDEEAFALIQPELEKLGDNAKAELTNAVKYKASLVMAGYKAMSDQVKELFDEAIITKDASPSLKLVVPKADK